MPVQPYHDALTSSIGRIPKPRHVAQVSPIVEAPFRCGIVQPWNKVKYAQTEHLTHSLSHASHLPLYRLILIQIVDRTHLQTVEFIIYFLGKCIRHSCDVIDHHVFPSPDRLGFGLILLIPL